MRWQKVILEVVKAAVVAAATVLLSGCQASLAAEKLQAQGQVQCIPLGSLLNNPSPTLPAPCLGSLPPPVLEGFEDGE